MAVTLGTKAIPMTLELNRGSDFSCVLHSDDGDWPDEAVITIEVGSDTWVADLNGPDASFTVDDLVVDAVIAEAPTAVKVWYQDVAAKILWGYGPVSVGG